MKRLKDLNKPAKYIGMHAACTGLFALILIHYDDALQPPAPPSPPPPRSHPLSVAARARKFECTLHSNSS